MRRYGGLAGLHPTNSQQFCPVSRGPAGNKDRVVGSSETTSDTVVDAFK